MSNPTNWQPIETAPRDGTRVLLFRHGPNNQIVCGWWNTDCYAKRPRSYWSHDFERICGTIDARQNPPTHWMPLPEPPQ